VYDTSYYGNVYICCHVANAGGIGSWYVNNPTIYGTSLLLQCYTENGSSAPSDFGSDVMVIGGATAATANGALLMRPVPYGQGYNVEDGRGWEWSSGPVQSATTRMFISGANYLLSQVAGFRAQAVGSGDRVDTTPGKALIYNTGTSSETAVSFQNDNGVVGSITTNGSSTAFNVSSDHRIKENVVPMTGAAARLMELNPVRFNFIADPGKTVDGFIAHEAAEVVPEAVTGEKDAMREEEYEITPDTLDDETGRMIPAVMGTRTVPDYQGIDQAKLVPLLTAALQEALTRIAALEAAQ
jgi:hypothetical protein